MRTLTVTTLSLAALVFAVPALAQQVPPEVQARMNAMQAQIDAQQAQLNELKAQVAAQYNAPPPAAAKPAAPVAAPPAPAATVAIKNGSPTIASSDSAFTFTVKGLFQADAATYSQDSNLPAAVTARDLNSGTNIRRARVIFGGKMFKDFDYNLTFDFGGAGAEDVGRVHEAWIQYSGFRNAKLRVGEFAPNVGLADAGSQSGAPFLERPAVAEIARNVTGGDTRMGVAAWNSYDRWLYSVALTGNTVSQLNTAATGFNTINTDEQFGIAARIAGTPYKSKNTLIHAGLSYSAIVNPADAGAAAAIRYPVQLRDRPELRVDGTRLVDTGALNADSATATGVELAWQYKTVFLSSEAFQFDIKRRDPAAGATDPQFSGWYLEGGWVLTGESRKYNTQTAAFDGITPAHNFDPKGGHWGAFELVGRYSTLDLDYHDLSTVAADRVRGGQQDISTIGLNWTLNPSVRFVFQGQNVKIDRLNSSGVQSGQEYTSFAIRSQFNY